MRTVVLAALLLFLLPAAPAAARPWGPPPGRVFVATFETSLGDIRCVLLHENAPKTVRNFVELARGAKKWIHPATGQPVRRRLYDGTVFHRVIPGFMIQGGDPMGDGTGGPGYSFPDEDGEKNRFARGTMLAMANRGPDTQGSQFFITDAPTPHLDGRHTVFGACGNPEVVTRIANVPRDEADRPTTPVRLARVVISVR